MIRFYIFGRVMWRAYLEAIGMSKPLADIEAVLVHETEKAYLLETDKGKAWVPKSVTEDNQDGTYTLPEDLALEKGLV